jgi:hypothetical protein
MPLFLGIGGPSTFYRLYIDYSAVYAGLSGIVTGLAAQITDFDADPKSGARFY